MAVRLTHVEVSVRLGFVEESAGDLDRLLGDVFGWTGATTTVDHPQLGPSVQRTYDTGAGVALVLREREIALGAGTEDHLGFVVDDGDLDALVEGCVRLARDDDRVELAYVEDGRAAAIDIGDAVFRTFFVRYLLPLWFQFESRRSKE